MTAPAFTGAFVMVDPEHVAQVGPAAALLFARICWRSERTGSWPATRETMMRETGLSLDTIRTAVKRLRDKEWVRAERASATDATLVWSPILAGQGDIGKGPTSPGDNPHLPDVGIIPISSYETSKTTDTPPLRVVADAPAVEGRPEVRALCERLAERIVANGCRPPTITKAWLDACRLLIDKDQRTPEQIAKAIDWCQTDEFWRANILSMPTLRKQYDKLRLAAQRDSGRPRAHVPAPDEAYDPAHAASLPPPPPRSLYA